MSRNRRLQQMAEFINERESEAGRALSQAAKEVERVQAQLEALCRFRNDYVKRLQEGKVMNAIQLHEYRAFLSSLGRAIGDQETALAKMRQEYAALRQTWRQAHCRSQGIRKMQAKLVQQERQSLERCLQREQDDRAAARRRKKTAK